MDRRALERFRKNRGALVGLALVVLVIVFSYGAPLVSQHLPYVPDFEFGRGVFGTPGAPSSKHWLGTDTIFRDLLVRLAHGGRLSLEVAFVATTIAVTLGTAVGVLSGYFKGARTRLDAVADAVGVVSLAFLSPRALVAAAWCFAIAALLRLIGVSDRALVLRKRLRAIDLADAFAGLALVGLFAKKRLAAFTDPGLTLAVVLVAMALLVARVFEERRSREVLRVARVDFDDLAMRGVDVLLAFPFLLLVMALSAAIDRTSEATIFLVLGLTAWTGTARVIRSKTLQLRELEFVVASRAAGQSTPGILLRHIVPNVAGIAIVLGTNSVAAMIVAEAALSFLGLSLPPPAASWGRMLDEGRPYYSLAPWLLIAPAVAILVAVLGFNLLGEGLRDAFDPKDA